MATTDIATELAGRQSKVSEAEQVVRDVEAQAREAANRLELASREFAALPPDQLDETGNPKPKTEAARLAAQIKALKDPPVAWSRRVEQARTTARQARIELDRFSGANVAEIARANEHVGREAGGGLRAQLRGTIEAIDGYYSAQAQFSAMVAKASGLDPQTELPATLSDKLSNLRRDLQRLLPEVEDPLASVVQHGGEECVHAGECRPWAALPRAPEGYLGSPGTPAAASASDHSTKYSKRTIVPSRNVTTWW